VNRRDFKNQRNKVKEEGKMTNKKIKNLELNPGYFKIRVMKLKEKIKVPHTCKTCARA